MAHDLVSLITVVDGILHSTDQDSAIPEDHEKTFLESLREKATSLTSLLLDKSVKQQHQSKARETFEALQSEIRDAAHEAEDIIESHAVDLMMMSETDGTLLTSEHSTSRVMDKFDAAKDKLMKIITENDQSPEENVDLIVNATLSAATDPTTLMPNNTAMVGLDDDTLHLKYRLTNQRREREIIPIVGMGGIGKTTLARNLYDDSLIVSHFEVRAWATVSQDYNLRAMLLGLLRCTFKKIPNEMLQKDTSELGLTLYQRLCGTRYLVVLDDTWSKTAWDEVRRFLPIENSRSRILITSRNLDVAKHPDSACEEHQMHLLSNAHCWDLLRQKVYDAEKEESCPPLIEEIGQKIARDCGGLPLAISVIGGLLSVDKYSKDLWEHISTEIRAILSQGGNDFSKTISLSYDNLPLHLKPCFLYMAAFPEDFEVKGSKLVKLWAAEGFLWMPSGSNKTLEDVGKEYLKALVGRNLIHVTSTNPYGVSNSYGMHDLLRDLCARKADDENFLHVVKDGKVGKFRRVGVHQFSKHFPHLEELSSVSRTLLCISPTSERIDFSPILSALRLLRVLDLFDRDFRTFPAEILKLFNLRFLAISCIRRLPSEIWRLRNLQTVISRYYQSEGLTLSHEAWEVPGLRHIIGCLIRINFKITRDQENLQTIHYVGLSDLLDSNLINSVPNVRNLGIGIDKEYGDTTTDLTHMHRLETLNLICVFPRENLPPFKLPSYLKTLAMQGCPTSARFLNGVVGALQHLEVLKIRSCRFQNEGHNEHDWVVGEDVEFCSLKLLDLYGCNLRRWEAESSSFPSLRHLKLVHCFDLEAIPTSFGEISTLEMIDVSELPITTEWAKEILETQREYGNENVRLKMV